MDDLRISPGRFKKGEWVYTCKCGREGEWEWMRGHIEQAHGVRGAKLLEAWRRVMPKRREYANIRDVSEVSDREFEQYRIKLRRMGNQLKDLRNKILETLNDRETPPIDRPLLRAGYEAADRASEAMFRALSKHERFQRGI